MIRISDIKESLLCLVFPGICHGCGNELPGNNSLLCIRCLEAMPETNFELYAGNPLEKKFWGRMQVVGATAQYYFTRESLMQHLMHQFKYRRNKDLGYQLGKLMGEGLNRSGRFKVDALIPLPLFGSREKKRGFNQAAVLCEGISASLGIPVLKDVIIRSQHTDTQTSKGRVERWQNIEGKFVLVKAGAISKKHVLLVDDVVTTGATLEACGSELLKAGDLELSIATLCYAAR